MTIKVIDIVVFLSNGNMPLVYQNVHIEEEFLLALLRAHNNHTAFFITTDNKSIDETKDIVAMDFASPHVVGMRVKVENTYTITTTTD